MNSAAFEIILASGSPRRQAFFREMGLTFQVQVKPVDETFPPKLNGIQIAQHIVRQKAQPFLHTMEDNQLVITADTVVWHEHNALGKPQNVKEARNMLHALSAATHEVITAVGFLQKDKWESLYEVSKVSFAPLSDDEIETYLESGSPMDKAGAYGIQDNFGIRNVTYIEGSYSNIIGLPVPQDIGNL